MYQKMFYVSPAGRDENCGSQDAPFRTMERARQEVRKYNRNMSGDIAVLFADGLYREDTICFDAKDSGTNGFHVIYRAEENARPVFSGGVVVSHWEKRKMVYLWQAFPKFPICGSFMLTA